MEYKAQFKEISGEFGTLQKAAPDIIGAFGKLHSAAMKDGALDKKTKELIAMAIGINARCEGCIISHVRAAVKAGVTREEFVEAIGVAILMGGGPGSVYGAKALAAADEFLE